MQFDYAVGDEITYEAFGGEVREVLVQTKHEEIKNGRPGFTGVLIVDETYEVWGYDDQITYVRRAPRK